MGRFSSISLVIPLTIDFSFFLRGLIFIFWYILVWITLVSEMGKTSVVKKFLSVSQTSISVLYYIILFFWILDLFFLTLALAFFAFIVMAWIFGLRMGTNGSFQHFNRLATFQMVVSFCGKDSRKSLLESWCILHM